MSRNDVWNFMVQNFICTTNCKCYLIVKLSTVMLKWESIYIYVCTQSDIWRTASIKASYWMFKLMDTLFGILYHLSCKGIVILVKWKLSNILHSAELVTEWKNSAIPEARRLCDLPVSVLSPFSAFKNVSRRFTAIWLDLARLTFRHL
jgi:hypothetical protein